MKKYYRYIEILMSLRKEMLRLNNIIGKLQDYIKVDGDYESIKVNASLIGQSIYENPFKVYVELKKRYIFCNNMFNEYLELSKLPSKDPNQYLFAGKNDLARFLLTDRYDCLKSNGSYDLVKTPNYRLKDLSEEQKNMLYKPQIVVTNKDAFDTILNTASNTDIAKLRSTVLRSNHDMFEIFYNRLRILLDVAYKLNALSIDWDGLKDEFIVNLENVDFELYFHDLEIPSDKLPSDLLEILEKHENEFDKLVVSDLPSLEYNKLSNVSLKIDETEDEVISFIKI